MRSIGYRTVRSWLCCAMLFVCATSIATAQFDLEKVKKKAKEVLSKDSEDEKKEEKKTAEPEQQKKRMSWEEEQAKHEKGQELLKEADFAVRPLANIRSVYSGMLAEKREAQQFNEKCKKADYQNWRVKIAQVVQEDPELKEIEEYRYNELMHNFPKHFAQLTDEYLIKEINNAIEVAYAEKAKGAARAGAAREAAEAALLTAEGVLMVTPDNVRVQELRDDARAAAESMGASFAAAVYSGPFHQEHVGKIVFSSSPITAGQENAAAITSSFNAGDRIYGMMYFDGTYKEVTGGSRIAYTKMLVDGNEMVSYNFKLNDEEGARSWLKSEVVPDPAQSTTRGALLFTEKLKNLSPRRHTIIIRTTDDYNKTIAEGEFSLNCRSGLDKIAEVHRQLGDKKLAGVGLPAPAMRNAGLEKQMKAALASWSPKKPIKVIITDRDWTIQYHPVSGAIVSRTINTTTVFKLPDGSCRYFEISFKQQYTGRNYGRTQQFGVGDSADILCSKVK